MPFKLRPSKVHNKPGFVVQNNNDCLCSLHLGQLLPFPKGGKAIHFIHGTILLSSFHVSIH